MSKETDKSEPTPFEKMRDLAAKVVSVPKSEMDRREAEWRKERESVSKRNAKVLGKKPK